jgi:hypothetical protein
MEIRKTDESDIDTVMSIYARARVFMKANGNPNQWSSSGPSLAKLRQDMTNGVSYVVLTETRVVGTFALMSFDPNYASIAQGDWPNQEPYVVIHRMASIQKGVGTYILENVCRHYRNVRIDTHKDNIPMLSLLKKTGFRYCGVIPLLDGDQTSRVAFIRINPQISDCGNEPRSL